ncbi:MAG: hypothetical protein QGI45_02035 [Myxococcota bacterium]|jgi:hypothetical protein|nr:hypothetical protein [Myxococcota bacterium]
MRSLIFALFCLFTQPLLATTVVPLSLAELTKKADLIVEVTIESRSAAWQGQRIYTTSRAQITHTLKDQNSQRSKHIDIQSLGGVVGQIGQKVHGAATLETGKQYLLFLIEPEPEKYFVYGMAQGVITMMRNDKGQLAIAPGQESRQHGQLFDLNQLRKSIKQNRHEIIQP